MNNKKSQVTIFIIMGLILLISTILFLFLKGNIIREEIAPGVSMIVEELPTEFSPVKPFVEECLIRTTKEGLEILGRRGGYIYTNKLNPGLDSVYFAPFSDPIIPYWFYLDSDMSCHAGCKFNSKRLTKNAIAKQLTQYVEENLMSCLRDFKGIEELGFEVEASTPKVEVIIARDDVVAKLEYPMTVSRNEQRFELQNFYANLNLDFDKIYEMALYITQLQREYRFLEGHTLNLIDGFSAKEAHMLPPRYDSDFSVGGVVRWKKPEVKQNLQNVVAAYIQVLRMMDTPNWVEIRTTNQYGDKLYNHGMAVPNNSSINDLEVQFQYYDFWDMYFDLNCNGNICEPQSAFNDLIPINFGLERYHFAYDVSYPVMVEIYDANAFNGQGYTFNYMLQANLRDNQPLTSDFEPLIAIDTFEPTMLCDEDKRHSGEIRIELYDTLSNEKIDDADILYSCIEACYIGKTKDGMLNEKFPICTGGTVEIRKEGYEDYSFSLSTSVNHKSVYRIQLNPVKEIEIELKKRVLKKMPGGWSNINQVIDLEEKDTATIMLTKPGAVDLVEPGDKLRISEGEFEIDIHLNTEKEIYIPGRVDNGFVVDELYQKEIYSTTSFTYTFTKADLQKDKLTFYVWYADLWSVPESQRVMEDMDLVTLYESMTSQYHRDLWPK